ncbi:MAG: cysteine--tRNA ligase [Parcubacteria bacterium C7867-001]|nr:MAG: cysteine--tRNA ligase [Parcubacteria bacterium C7867-001]
MWPFTRKPKANQAPILFTNTLSGTKEIFAPLRAGVVSMYSCGPTVYAKQHIGNLRPYIFADTIARILADAGYHVRRVINITDVGHLVSNADEGEDKMLVGAKRENLRPEEIAERYTGIFLEDLTLLNILTTDILFPKATEYVNEQIEMIKALEAKGHTYRTKDGLYFDTSTFPAYGRLGGGDVAQTREYALADLGRRIKENKEKKHAADFALWKFAPFGVERLQEWPSPWGTGFPGWHIECSAMSKALLGETIDIHTGGMDHIPVHHNNEIAQSESVSERPLARFWMHEAFITMNGEKISKSLGNDIYLSQITEHGLHPLSLRYLYLGAHYRTPVDFTWESIEAANEALLRLWRHTATLKKEAKGIAQDSEASRRLIAVVREDLSTAAALALLWEAINDDELTPKEAWGVVEAAERVLGLMLTNPPEDVLPKTLEELPSHVQELEKQRQAARKRKDYASADALRINIEDSGYRVEDGPSGTMFIKK